MTSLSRAVTTLLPSVASVAGARAVGGGCISEASRVTVRDQAGRERDLFVKSNSPSFLDNFQCEYDALVELGEPGVIGVPRPLAVGTAVDRAWLVTEWVEQSPRDREFFESFGKALSELHRATRGTQVGWVRDNYLGSASQINSKAESWVEFVCDHRIGFQLRWATDQGLADRSLRQDAELIIDRMDDLLAGREEATSLLHGDLWSGNYLCGNGGAPVIIDPAAYRGCREAEFGMLRLFGSCPEGFYRAYDESFPLPSGWQRRVNVYVLYHLLNHLNLFGRGYHDQCRSLAAETLRST